MSIKKFKVKQDPVTAEWYVLRKELDLNSNWHWVIRGTTATREEAMKMKRHLELAEAKTSCP